MPYPKFIEIQMDVKYYFKFFTHIYLFSIHARPMWQGRVHQRSPWGDPDRPSVTYIVSLCKVCECEAGPK